MSFSWMNTTLKRIWKSHKLFLWGKPGHSLDCDIICVQTIFWSAIFSTLQTQFSRQSTIESFVKSHDPLTEEVLDSDAIFLFVLLNQSSPIYRAHGRSIPSHLGWFTNSTSTCNDIHYRFHPLKIGGLMGLCIGFSFISSIEILYWLLIRFPKNVLC